MDGILKSLRYAVGTVTILVQRKPNVQTDNSNPLLDTLVIEGFRYYDGGFVEPVMKVDYEQDVFGVRAHNLLQFKYISHHVIENAMAGFFNIDDPINGLTRLTVCVPYTEPDTELQVRCAYNGLACL